MVSCKLNDFTVELLDAVKNTQYDSYETPKQSSFDESRGWFDFQNVALRYVLMLCYIIFQNERVSAHLVAGNDSPASHATPCITHQAVIMPNG